MPIDLNFDMPIPFLINYKLYSQLNKQFQLFNYSVIKLACQNITKYYNSKDLLDYVMKGEEFFIFLPKTKPNVACKAKMPYVKFIINLKAMKNIDDLCF